MPQRVSLGDQAAALGHAVVVTHEGKRFRLECSCGVKSSTGWKRKTTFDFMTEHLAAVVRVARSQTG